MVHGAGMKEVNSYIMPIGNDCPEVSSFLKPMTIHGIEPIVD